MWLAYNDNPDAGDDWNKFELKEYARTRGSLIWVTQKREEIAIENMNTWHLFHAIRMIFNHSVPVEHATGPHKRYNGPQYTDAKMRKFVLIAMLQELATRFDIQNWMYDELNHMADTVNYLLKGKYPPIKLKPKNTTKFDDI